MFHKRGIAKTHNHEEDRMKHTVIETALVVGLFFLLLTGCEDPFSSKDDDDDAGTAPTIGQVNLYRYDAGTDQYIASFTFSIGQIAYLEVYASDPDLDMTTLRAKTTHNATANGDTDELPMDSQTAVDMVYFTYTTIIGPAGQWTAEFQIDDAAGNSSRWYSRTVTVVE